MENELKVELDNTILDYQVIPTLEDPIFWLSVGGVICLLAGLIFADLMKSKLKDWSIKEITPLPLGNPRTVSSWIAFFSGLTIIFTSALSIINFSATKSLFFSLLISVLFGTTMWKAIKDLFTQVYNGTIKEIDEFF